MITEAQIERLRSAIKVRPSQDLVFTQYGVPTGDVIKAHRESNYHEVCPEWHNIAGYVFARFDLSPEEQWMSWAGTLITIDTVNAEIEKFDYFIDGKWMPYSEAICL